MGWKFVVGIGAMGLLATAGATVAHYIFGAPIDIGDKFIISRAFTIALFLVACGACSLLAIALGALFGARLRDSSVH